MVPGEFQRDFCREMEDAPFCPTERKTLLTHLQSQHFNWFRLDSDGAHKVHKCTQSILWIQRAICKRPDKV